MMPSRCTRRTLLAQLSIGAGLSGCLGRSPGNIEASAAARLFNDAYDTFRKAKSSLRDARDAWDVEDWAKASRLFAQARSQFERAESDFGNAARGARKADCGAIRKDARKMGQKCNLYARACRNWKEAATLYERGNDGEAEELRVDGDEAYDRAADVPTAREKGQNDPTCINRS